MESSRPRPWTPRASRTTRCVLGLGLERCVFGLGLGSHVMHLDVECIQRRFCSVVSTVHCDYVLSFWLNINTQYRASLLSQPWPCRSSLWPWTCKSRPWPWTSSPCHWPWTSSPWPWPWKLWPWFRVWLNAVSLFIYYCCCCCCCCCCYCSCWSSLNWPFFPEPLHVSPELLEQDFVHTCWVLFLPASKLWSSSTL